MVRTRGDQANSAKFFVLLSSIPPRLYYLSKEENWRPIKDEIRSLVHVHRLADIPEPDVKICSRYGNLFALCEYTNRDDAREVFKLARGHIFENRALQAWVGETAQNGCILLDGPRDRVSGNILPPSSIASPNPSVSRLRVVGGHFRPRTNQARLPNFNMATNRPGRDLSMSPDRNPPESFEAAGVPAQDSYDNVDAILAPHPYTKFYDLFQQQVGNFSSSVVDANEVSDSSKMLHNTPELSPSSRVSSVSAIPDACFPVGSSGQGTFQYIPGSPYTNHNSSISSSSSPYTPSSSRNQSGSSHLFPDTASGEAYKVIIRNVRSGVTHKDLSELLVQEMPPHSFVQFKRPKQGEDNKWSVEFAKEEDAEKAKECLHNLEYKGQKLKVHVSNGAHGRRISSGGSFSSAASSSTTPGPTIIDGSVTGWPFN